MYDVYVRRTNIYLDERQDALLRALSERRDVSVAALVRAAVDEWLERQGARAVDDDEWARRFGALLDRRERVAAANGHDESQVGEHVAAAVAEVRARRARARRR